VVALDLHTSKAVAEYRDLAKRESQGPSRLSTIDTVYFCGGGRKSFTINALGEMSICVVSQQDTFDIRRSGLNPAWEHSLREVRNQKRTRVTKCVGCRIQSLCGMCPANGEMENGDKESPVRFCVMWHTCGRPRSGSRFPRTASANFCVDGTEHASLMESATRIRTREIDVESWVGPQQILPILTISLWARADAAVVEVIDRTKRSLEVP